MIVLIGLSSFASALVKNMSISYDANYLNMSDGCEGEIGFMPKESYELDVCANNGATDLGCKTYSSGEYNKSTNISTDYFVDDNLNNYDMYNFANDMGDP